MSAAHLHIRNNGVHVEFEVIPEIEIRKQQVHLRQIRWKFFANKSSIESAPSLRRSTRRMRHGTDNVRSIIANVEQHSVAINASARTSSNQDPALSSVPSPAVADGSPLEARRNMMSIGVEKTTPSGINHIDQLISYRKWAVDDDRTITWTITQEDAVFAYEPYGIRNELPSFRAVSNPIDIANINKAMDVFNSLININLKYINEKNEGEATIRFNAYDPEVNRAIGGGWAYGPNQNSWGGDVWTSWYTGYGTSFTLHEVGHVLGLDHPGHITGLGVPGFTTLETVMSYTGGKKLLVVDKDGTYISNAEIQNVGIYDIAALQYLHGANMSHNADDTVYRFDPGIGFYTTLWDGGGQDTIDLSNYQLGSSISLAEGTYTSITYDIPANVSKHVYTGENAIGIAYGAVIENAIGTQGNDIIHGNSVNNRLIGGAGNDHLYGLDGNDHLEGGDGDDVLDGGTGADVMIGGRGNDIYQVDNINDVVVEMFDGGTDTAYLSIDVLNMKKYLNIENFIAKEGGMTAKIMGNAQDNMIIGNSSANTLHGCEGNDVIIGGKGNDTLNGGKGDDTFVFHRGDGNDYLMAGLSTPDDIDTLSFRGDISHEQLWFSTDAKRRDLTISIIGTTDSVRVQNFFKYRENILDTVEGGNGKALDTSNIDRLIDAMAAFAPPALGQTTLPDAYQQALAPVLSATWV